MGSGDIERSHGSGGHAAVAVAGKPRGHQRALLVFGFSAGGCSRPSGRRGASKRRTLSFSERHQNLVDINYCKKLQVEALQRLQNQTRDRMVQSGNDDRAERKRFLRLLQDEQFELDMEEAIQKKRDAEIARTMMEEHERLIKEENAAEDKRNRVKAQYSHDLEKQLEEQEKKKQEAYEQLLKEKLMIDEIVRKIYEEDQLERQQRLEKMNTTRRYIEEFQKEQALWRKKKREEMEEENRKIIEFAKLQQQREEDRMAKVQESEEKRLQLQNLEEAEEKLRKQKELKQDFMDQMALKELVLQAAKEEEETFRKAMLAKFAEDDRIELMNAQKQRMKQLEHKRAVEKLIEERRNQFLADKQRELQEWQWQQRRQGCINAIVEEERLKLLKEHAIKLLGYLPKGVFKNEDDIDMLGEEFRKAYQKRSEICEK
ncbi:hypothetical protein FD755_013728 [Muntiacus reevesi]|uniref:Meiosis-specific nuclear structural protein 1 n=1 Tax=Muntiacus reevesi TaxID=9886 RepID=A0A5N3XMV2_MUNRE|nr:hypothetical protein FD755_013728 [Muntiacus reevesi]